MGAETADVSKLYPGTNDSPIPPIVTITQIELDKYGGRHVATVLLPTGNPLAPAYCWKTWTYPGMAVDERRGIAKG